MRLVKATPISESAFLPFGHVLQHPKDGVRENFAANVFNGRKAAKANLALVYEKPAEARFVVTTLERHPYSTQSFFPLGLKRYLVVVCGSTAAGDPALCDIRAFVLRGDQAVSYSVGIWHMAIKTLDEPGVFAMLIHEDSSPSDCEFRPVENFEVSVEP